MGQKFIKYFYKADAIKSLGDRELAVFCQTDNEDPSIHDVEPKVF